MSASPTDQTSVPPCGSRQQVLRRCPRDDEDRVEFDGLPPIHRPLPDRGVLSYTMGLEHDWKGRLARWNSPRGESSGWLGYVRSHHADTAPGIQFAGSWRRLGCGHGCARGPCRGPAAQHPDSGPTRRMVISASPHVQNRVRGWGCGDLGRARAATAAQPKCRVVPTAVWTNSSCIARAISWVALQPVQWPGTTMSGR